jgi:hypothetical protein
MRPEVRIGALGLQSSGCSLVYSYVSGYYVTWHFIPEHDSLR